MNISIASPRGVEHLVAGTPARDGAGVKPTRVLTQPLQGRLDPCLMLDAFGSDDPDDWIAGFPDHPHRGFETITCTIAGRIRHRDSAGHEGVVHDGGLQWMTAGRGVIHSETPEQNEGRMEGFQLWLNLPSRDKMSEPWYCDLEAVDIPVVELPGASARVIAGASHGVKGTVQREVTEPLCLDIHVDAGARFEQSLPASHNAFVYVYSGALATGELQVPMQRMAILANGGDGVIMQAGEAPTRALLIASAPLNEPIAQYGPFVMNSNEQIFQAVEDFRAGRLA